MITAAATATTNRIPLLLLPGDIFSCRQPDPVLQQLEVSHDYTLSVNDCFKPVSKYWDRIARPEQLMTACINAMRVLTDPVETGAVTLCLPQDVQSEAYDYEYSFFEKRFWHIDREPVSERALDEAVQLILKAKKPLLFQEAVFIIHLQQKFYRNLQNTIKSQLLKLRLEKVLC